MFKDLEVRPSIPPLENQYLRLLYKIQKWGSESDDRTNVGTRKLFGETLKADLSQGFPLLTTKKVPFRIIEEELLWFIRGETNIKSLVDQNVNIWNEWPLRYYLGQNGKGDISSITTPERWEEEMQKFVARIKEDEEFARRWGELGPVYGYQWRHWKTPDGGEIDQLAEAVRDIKHSPNSRRIEVLAWNPADTQKMAVSGLPPCHMEFQFQVDRGKLNLAMKQRSVDSFLGLPFNIASYALLLHIVANITDNTPGELTLFLGDTHLYKTHREAVETQLARTPRELPVLLIEGKFDDIDHIDKSRIKLENYNPHPAISAPIAV